MGYVLVVEAGLGHGQKYSTAEFKFAKTPTLALLDPKALICGAARLAEVQDVNLLMRSARKCQLTFPQHVIPCNQVKTVLRKQSPLVSKAVRAISFLGHNETNPGDCVPSVISHIIDSVQPLHLCCFLSLPNSNQSSIGQSHGIAIYERAILGYSTALPSLTKRCAAFCEF